MTSFMYSIFIHLYKLGFKIAALFYPKASKRNLGIGLQSKELDLQLNQISTERILVHCASLGEYEQVKPIVQWIIDHTNYDVLVSFFSPSGYEDCELINDRTIKCYLPFDVKSDQEKFISKINPSKIIITKNEWWWNLLQVIKERQIPSYLVSSTIRSDHYFIKKPRAFFNSRMAAFDTVFVVNDSSKKHLQTIFDNKIIVAGDTRKDRVQSIKNETGQTDTSHTVIYGSIWLSDLQIIKQMISELPEYNHLIYPHDLSDGNITKLKTELSCRVIDQIPNNMHGLTAIISDIEDTALAIEYLKSKEIRKEIKFKLKSYFSASQSATEVICKCIFQ